MTTITVSNLKVTFGKIEELEKQMESPELEDLLWYGITYIVTTLKGVKIFYIASKKICKQPIEGLLYDLGLEEAYLAALYKDDPLEFANKMAIATIIKYLHEHYKYEE